MKPPCVTPSMEDLMVRMIERYTGDEVAEAKMEGSYWYVKIGVHWAKVSDVLKAIKPSPIR